MVRRTAYRLAIALVAAVATACSSATARFYTLDALAASDGGPPASYAVAVGPVSVPAAVDRPQFVVQVAPNRVDLDEFNRWAAPLGDSIARVVAANLVVLLGTPRVATSPLPPDFAPTYRVAISVQRFESVAGQAAIVEALWSVRRSGGGDARAGQTVAREAVSADGFDALAAAHSRALATLSSDIAAAIRASPAPVR